MNEHERCRWQTAVASTWKSVEAGEGKRTGGGAMIVPGLGRRSSSCLAVLLRQSASPCRRNPALTGATWVETRRRFERSNLA